MGMIASEGDYEGHISGPVTVTLPPPETGRKLTVRGPGAVRQFGSVLISPSEKPEPARVITFQCREGSWVDVTTKDGAMGGDD